MNPFILRKEDVVRAICDSHWDQGQKRFLPGYLVGRIFRSRLEIFGLKPFLRFFIVT